MKLSDVTALGRPFDPNYPTNRAIGLLSAGVVVAGAAYRLLAGDPLLDSALWGIGAGLTVFLAWALARELDPDHDLSAFVAAGLMIVGLLLWAQPELLLVFWLLLALRVVNRTTGLPARWLDSLGLLGLGGWLTWQGHWAAGLLTVAAFALDGWLAPALRREWILALLALLGTVALAVFHGDITQVESASTPTILAVAAMVALFSVVIATSRQVTSLCDQTGEPLQPARLRAAQALALAAGLLLACWNGTNGVIALLPAWAAMLGVGLYRLGLLARRATLA
ncbi:MAG: hypothetical protein ACK2U9_17370 [Anaerolineae bacterium]